MIFGGIEICCPVCRGDLREAANGEASLGCLSCDRRFPVVLGIPDLRVFPDPYIEAEADRAKGLRLATRFDELSFAQLVDFYYSITPAVPPRHAKQYTRGLMAGPARAASMLGAWEGAVVVDGPSDTLLEIGCGAAPLLVAASARYSKLVGVDIAFRWLAVAKKRLAEEGLNVPLICACAEALPFPNGAFDRVVADSVIEHAADQGKVLAECHRVLGPSGHLFASTPNRYSLGPDPHVGLWAGGLLPARWIACHVRWQGGVPPRRRLLSAGALVRLMREAGFLSPRTLIPELPAGQRRHFGVVARCLIDLYQLVRRLPMGRALLRWVGPSVHAVAEKSGQPGDPAKALPGVLSTQPASPRAGADSLLPEPPR